MELMLHYVASTPVPPSLSDTSQVPVYDFRESRRTGYRTVEVPESRVVILEGIYALSSRLRPMVSSRRTAWPVPRDAPAATALALCWSGRLLSAF